MDGGRLSDDGSRMTVEGRVPEQRARVLVEREQLAAGATERARVDIALRAHDHLVAGDHRGRPSLVTGHSRGVGDLRPPHLHAGRPIYGIQVARPVGHIDVAAVDCRSGRDVASGREGPLHAQVGDVADTDLRLGALVARVLRIPTCRIPITAARPRGGQSSADRADRHHGDKPSSPLPHSAALP